jgi:uncharacterized delta-60 repeat protein
MTPRLRLLLPLSTLALLSLAPFGCQQILGIQDTSLDPDAGRPDGSNPGEGGGSGASSGSSASSPDFSFAILTTNGTVPLGGNDVVEIEIRRTGGFDGEVTVTPTSPPVGLIIEPVKIPAGQSNAEVVVGAQAPLAIGNKISFTLTATSGDLKPKTASVTDAPVTDRPGAPDQTFGAALTGLAAVSFGADDAGGFYDFELAGDQIVVTGQGFGGLGGVAFVTTRLNSSGSIDPAFAGGTIVRTLFVGSTASAARAVAIGHQVNGRLISMGWHEKSAPGDIALIRYGIDGAVGDPLFGNSGKSLVDLGGFEEVSDGLVLPNDRILVAGSRDNNLMVARISSDGYLDNSFAPPNGYLTLALGQPSNAQAIVVDSQNRILVVGQVGMTEDRDLVVARYLSDGQPDMAFETGGHRIIAAPGADELSAAVAVLSDGRILLAGNSNANGSVDFLVRRLLANGASDPSFGTDGVTLLPITKGNDSAEDMVVLPDGRILVVGNASGGDAPGPVLARYTRDGSLDPHFGTGGVRSLFVGDSGSIHCAAVYPGHKVIIGGGNEGGTPGPGTFGVVARLWM